MVTSSNIRSNYETYKHFMDNYGPRIVGKEIFENNCLVKTPEEWMTAAEEAFGLTAMENYHERVHEKVKNNRRIDARWTVNGEAKRNQGTAQEGIKYYTKVYKEVQASRKEVHAHGRRYMEDKKKEGSEKLTGKRKRKQENQVKREDGLETAMCTEFELKR